MDGRCLPVDATQHLTRSSTRPTDLLRGEVPKAVRKITDDVEALLAFYDYPAEHWIHLRTTNPIESIFATMHNRSKITKGAGTRPRESPWPTS